MAKGVKLVFKWLTLLVVLAAAAGRPSVGAALPSASSGSSCETFADASIPFASVDSSSVNPDPLHGDLPHDHTELVLTEAFRLALCNRPLSLAPTTSTLRSAQDHWFLSGLPPPSTARRS